MGTEKTKAANKQKSGNAADESAQPAQPVQVGVQLRAVESSGRPTLSNFTVVQGGAGMVLVDFGFLEPQTLSTIVQAGQTSTKKPETVGGQLASRVAMNLQTASQLAQQLNDLLRRVRPPTTAGKATDVTEKLQ